MIQSAELVVRELTEIVTNKGSNIPRLCRVGEFFWFLLSFNLGRFFVCFFLLLFRSESAKSARKRRSASVSAKTARRSEFRNEIVSHI